MVYLQSYFFHTFYLNLLYSNVFFFMKHMFLLFYHVAQ